MKTLSFSRAPASAIGYPTRPKPKSPPYNRALWGAAPQRLVLDRRVPQFALDQTAQQAICFPVCPRKRTSDLRINEYTPFCNGPRDVKSPRVIITPPSSRFCPWLALRP